MPYPTFLYCHKQAIAEVNTEDFTLSRVFDINTDPFDLAIDHNGYVYVSPGSNQRENLKVYSLASGKEIPNTGNLNNTSIYAESYLFYNPQVSKVYSLTTGISPRDVDAFEVADGVIKNHYDSPYHGDYPLDPHAKITPDGQLMYNNSGVVFEQATYKSGDMVYAFSLGKKYNDYDFSITDQLTYAARTDGGIDVYKYGTKNYLYTIRKDLKVNKVHYQNGILVAIGTNADGNYVVESMDANTPGTPDVPAVPAPPPAPSPINVLGSSVYVPNESGSLEYFGDFDSGAAQIPLYGSFVYQFN